VRMNADRPQPEAAWRRIIVPSTEARLAEVDRWYLRFAGQLCRDEVPSDREFFEFMWLLAEAATGDDDETLAAAFETLKSLERLLPEREELDEWRGRLWTAQRITGLAHFSLQNRPG
jgi:hypothetical protein